MYLEIKFHDNDFTFPLQEALEFLWEYIKDNNGKYFSNGTPEKPFLYLHKANQLIPLINRTWALTTLLREVETMTRNIDEGGVNKYSKVDWLEKEVGPIQETHSKYLNEFDIEFHEEKNNEDQNGEHGWLNLTTGHATLT